MKKAIGERGSWFAKIDGERLPCVHEKWCTNQAGGMTYHDRFIKLGERQCDEFVEALRSSGKAILTRSRVEDHGEFRTAERSGYIAVFAISDLTVGDDGLHFRFTKRLQSLA